MLMQRLLLICLLLILCHRQIRKKDATVTSDKCIATTVSPGDQTDPAALLPDCCNTMQYENFLKKYDGLIARNKKLGCDHCAKCDSMNIKGIRVSTE